MRSGTESIISHHHTHLPRIVEGEVAAVVSDVARCVDRYLLVRWRSRAKRGTVDTS